LQVSTARTLASIFASGATVLLASLTAAAQDVQQHPEDVTHSCSCENCLARVAILMEETNIHVIQLRQWIARNGSGKALMSI
jgi:hypothetical protein